MIAEEEYVTTLNGVFHNGPDLANYLVHPSVAHAYIYVETPKVACTTVKRVLQLAEVGGDTSRVPGDVHDRGASPVKRVSDDVAGFKMLLKSPQTFIFCFVRNPFTRALSCYLDKFVQNSWERNRLSPKLGLDPQTAPSFERYLEAVARQPETERDIHWSTQTYLLRPNRLRYSFIGRFEVFKQHFDSVCRRLGITEYSEGVTAQHATGADNKKDAYFGPREIELIREIYKNDFGNFGYGWSPDIT